ncbi:retrovirus-related pol polyprotein from transposon TNT 1-94 [Tanacetum coccineum]|uniref:Retrovirus-related pol polyprotein from transposon TNT 1-94 n=1 Tax=Tanacetum coccineum TaxID=301880 RepID=A0ABQ5B202_9ASTR
MGSASGWLSRVSDYGGMEHGFLSQKGSGGEKGVKEKSLNRNPRNTSSGIGGSTESNDTMNEDTLVGVASVVKEGVTPSVVDMMVEKEKICSLEDTIFLESFQTLTRPVTTTASNAPGKSSYANITSKPSGKKVNVGTLFTPEGNGIDVVVPVDSICAISKRFANTTYGFFLGKKVSYHVVANYVRNTWGKYGLVRSLFSSSTGLFSFQFSSIDGLDAMLENGPWFIRNNPLILKKWHPDVNLLKEDVSTIPGRSSHAIVMIELRADVELKDNIVVAMPKITREGHYTCNVHVENKWKPPRCSSCKVFGHTHEECPKNTSAGEKKTVKKPSQTSRVPKKSTASSSGNKKKAVEPTIKVSNSNPFDVLNSVDNDVEFGTNGGTTNLVNNGATSSGSSVMNTDNDVEFSSNAPIVPTGIMESDSEVEVVFDETTNLRILTSGKYRIDKGYGTNSLLEQWRDSYPDNDDYDPYDDDMYENHDLSEHLQSICDDLDIMVHDRKKK